MSKKSNKHQTKPTTPAPASPPVVDVTQDTFTAPPEPLTPAQLAEQERQQYAVQFEAGVQLAKDGVPADNGISGPTLAGYATVDPVTKLRKDGPTLAQYVAAGYDAANYPPQGYLPVADEPRHVVVVTEVPKDSYRSGGGASQYRAGTPNTKNLNPGTPTTVRHTTATNS